MVPKINYECYFFEKKMFLISYKDFLNKIIDLCNNFKEQSAGIIKIDENHFAMIFLQRMPDDIDWSYQLLFNVVEKNVINHRKQLDCYGYCKDNSVYSSMLAGSNDFKFLTVQLLSDMIKKVIADYNLIKKDFTVQEHIFYKNTDYFKTKLKKE